MQSEYIRPLIDSYETVNKETTVQGGGWEGAKEYSEGKIQGSWAGLVRWACG